MSASKEQLWDRFQKLYRVYPELGLALDISRVNFPEHFLGSIGDRMAEAFHSMQRLEEGAIANPDERRMVGHYWLRNPELSPTPQIRAEIETTLSRIERFAAKIHGGELGGEKGPFKYLLIIGIGGSALGPQFVSSALSEPTTDRMEILFFDNTDPDGMDKVLSRIITNLGQTLCVVVSKSGGTKETRNGMLEAENAFRAAGINFARHAVAVTGEGSELDKYAKANGWLDRFPMWDWVGGRTSELSAVGLLPAALQGFDIRSLLRGAMMCDNVTRLVDLNRNPAARMAAMWFYLGNGKGTKDMVVLPYKDRLELFSRYLQQLVMESLGKENDLKGDRVTQGLAVYGNKGSTDQHAFVQQLREGLLNFFISFIEVKKDRRGPSMQVEPSVTAGDYLSGFFLGTRQALWENGRESITITLDEVSAFSIGVLIALFERTVGFYASLIGINAYHQPGVEAGKKAAATVIDLQKRALTYLREKKGHAMNAAQIASGMGAHGEQETIFKILEHLSANPDHKVERTAKTNPFESTYLFS